MDVAKAMEQVSGHEGLTNTTGIDIDSSDLPTSMVGEGCERVECGR